MNIVRWTKYLRDRLFPSRKPTRIETYLTSGQLPWTAGYWEYKIDYIQSVLQAKTIMQLFEQRNDLPTGFGLRLDERVVEYPWLISRLSGDFSWLLDAGGTLNYPHILDLAVLRDKSIVVYTLETGKKLSDRKNVSYIYADLRSTILRSQQFDRIV